MKAYLQKLCQDAETPLVAQHLAREYLQARILQSLQRAGAMQFLAFHGGTALRFLYEIPRYSEDLDFACVALCYELHSCAKSDLTGFHKA
jgi:predicted nucleotidyltransferase component of viral defense system